MSGAGQGILGLALALAGWMLPRRVAATRGGPIAAIILDAAPLVFVVAVLFVATGKAFLPGAVAFALGAGFAFADSTMRDVLREPVVFSALSELPQVFTHSHLYLPFAGTGFALGGALAAILAGVALLVVEPPLATPHPLAALAVASVVIALLRKVGRAPWLGGAARALRRLRPTGEPFADAARLGPVAMLIVHGIIARAERSARQTRLAPLPMPTPPRAEPRPIVLVQCESFFDARRAFPTLPRGFLAGFDAARGTYGRLDVPAWGANTMRAEFAVLTGFDDGALGYDRFNPYHALARAPLASQVRRLRDPGYRTICLHPFDRRFFRRDLAMPALGFEEFRGRETVGGARTSPYMSDPDLAGHVLRIVEEEGPRVFVFAVTMANHGPWLAQSPPIDPGLAGMIADVPQRAALLRYLAGLRQSDEMLSLLIGGLERRSPAALLGFYGDHLPSLPRAFDHLGFDDWRSDYVIWTGSGRAARRRDLAAHELGRALVDLALAPATRDAVVAEPHDA